MTLRRVVAVLLLTLGGCKKSPATVDAGAPREATRDEAPRPVYGAEYVGDPAAKRLCGLLHGYPMKRREECCGEKAGSSMLQGECERMLSQALTDKVAAIEPKQLEACEDAVHRALEGCDWPGPSPFEVPEVCAQLVQGRLGDKARCRSSLECQSGLRCLGVGPTDPGRCGPPLGENALCAISVDALAASAMQRLDELHPECVGACGRRRCENAPDAGAACATNLECGVGRHCDGHCVEGAWAREGEACVQGACGVGWRCLGGTCRAPAAKGTACKQDQECVGGCVAGRCGPRCRTP